MDDRIQLHLDWLPHPTYVWRSTGNGDFCLLDVNEAARLQTDGKIASWMGVQATEFFSHHPDILKYMRRCLELQRPVRAEGAYRMRTTAANRYLITTYAFVPPDLVIGHTEDITERRELERELHHVQRLDSVGRLAGGVAHDFNNLLTAILGFADLLHRSLPEADPRRADVAEIQRAAESGAGLTRQLLAFSRKQVLQPTDLNLNDHIAAISQLLQRVLSERIDVRTSFQAQRLFVRADPTQLEQILLNLAINARDAMPTGGRLDISTDRVMIPGGAARVSPSLAPGTYARLVVSDTGVGMSAETMSHIFEPFFTTKGGGHGTGLGLSTVYGIIRQSGGDITVSSTVDAGTSFEIYLPETMPSDDALEITPDAPARDEARSSVTVLVVDDDRAVRTLAARALQREGFEVLQAPHGQDALDLIRDSRVALLLTDVVMPGMSGPALVTAARRHVPDLKVLLMSGYAPDALSTYGEVITGDELLSKPFTPDTLVARVNHVLQGAAPA